MLPSQTMLPCKCLYEPTVLQFKELLCGRKAWFFMGKAGAIVRRPKTVQHHHPSCL